MKNLTTRVPNYTHLLPLQYSNFCLSREWASLYSDRFYFWNANVHADQNKPFYIGIRMK